MTEARYDVIAIGNAIVDVMAPAADALVEELGMVRGGMALIDTDRANQLYAAMGSAVEISGGSAANTLAGLSALGAKCAFIGQVADDQLGEIFAHDIQAGGIDYGTPKRAGDPPTGRCLIFVSPDGQRTMNTFLGASHYLPLAALDESAVRDASVLYLEGYMWDPPEPRQVMRKAIEVARRAGRTVAFTTSEVFMIDIHGADFRALIDDGSIDILFCNHHELAALTGTEDFEAGVAQLAPKVQILVVTRSADGAIALRGGERAEVPAVPNVRVVDTTGAGDLFAAGFLVGHSRGKDLRTSAQLGALAAAEVIQHFGARPAVSLKALAVSKGVAL